MCVIQAEQQRRVAQDLKNWRNKFEVYGQQVLMLPEHFKPEPLEVDLAVLRPMVGFSAKIRLGCATAIMGT